MFFRSPPPPRSNLIHSYYMDVIILVSDESEKWRNMVIENKIKRVKKVHRGEQPRRGIPHKGHMQVCMHTITRTANFARTFAPLPTARSLRMTNLKASTTKTTC